jgi:hypothetical protein
MEREEQEKELESQRQKKKRITSVALMGHRNIESCGELHA